MQRWPETKRLLGLLVNSAGGAHARNARRLVHASRKQDRRLAAALLAAALAHTPEAEEVLRGARTRMARKPPALARELLRNFPKRRAAQQPPPAQGRPGTGERRGLPRRPSRAESRGNERGARREAAPRPRAATVRWPRAVAESTRSWPKRWPARRGSRRARARAWARGR